MQWQAPGSRQQARAAGFEPDKGNWGWNWMERWMVVRPWENRFLDFDLDEGIKTRESESSDEKEKPISNIGNGKTLPRLKSNNSNISNGKRVSSISSASKSANYALKTPTTVVQSRSSKPVSKDSIEGATSKRSVGSRSQSNPKERLALPDDKQGNKRLSLPGKG